MTSESQGSTPPFELPRRVREMRLDGTPISLETEIEPGESEGRDDAEPVDMPVVPVADLGMRGPGDHDGEFEEDLEEDDFLDFEDDGAAEENLEITPEFRAWVDALPLETPARIVEMLREFGYVGQDVATRAMALAAHRHLRRIKAVYVDGVPRTELPPKQNLLCVGPTGCGKTYLASLLFREVLQIPTATVDITSFSESGYIGDDTNSLVTRLLYAADGDLLKTKVGMILMDEFDKLASSSNRAVFAGQGTTKDVSGFGVQRELLKLLEAAVVPVPTEFSHNTFQTRPLLNTEDISFVACGAFSGLKSITRRSTGSFMNFASGSDEARHSLEDVAIEYDQKELDNIKHFQEYGFLPELIARFARVIPFQPLSRATLTDILNQNVVREARRELELAGIELSLSEAVAARVVDEAIERQVGARGLRNSLLFHLETAAYEAYSTPGTKKVVLEVVDGEVVASTSM